MTREELNRNSSFFYQQILAAKAKIEGLPSEVKNQINPILSPIYDEMLKCFNFMKDNYSADLAQSKVTHIDEETGGDDEAIKSILPIIHQLREPDKAESIFHRAVEQSPIAISIADVEGKIWYTNKKFRNMTGYSESELIGQNHRILKSGIQEPEVYINLWKTISRGDEWSGEMVNKRKDGKLFYERSLISPVKNSAGKILYFIGLKEDVSEKRDATHRLNETQELLESFIEATGDVFYRFSYAINNFVYIDPIIEKSTGYTPADLKEMTPHILKNFSNYENSLPFDITKLFEKRGSGEIFAVSYEMAITTKWGEKKWIGNRSYPWYDKEGNLLGAVGVFIDISEKKKREHELQSEKEKAEELSRVKSSFLANMSHELRTPLIGILGYTDLLDRTEINPQQKRIVEILQKSGNRLLDTLNMLLDLSKIENDKLQITFQRIELQEIAGEVVNLFSSLAASKELKLVTEFDATPIVMYTDDSMICRIINNLVNNAIKFTNKGEIIVTVTERRLFHQKFAVIQVKDTGIGIPKEKINQIWDEFRQVSEGIDRNFEGSGLGLAITKKLVEKLNGKIKVSSKPNIGTLFSVVLRVGGEVGSSFEVNLEQAIHSATIEGKEESEGLTDSKLREILYVEDDEIAYELVSVYLEGCFSVTHVKTGEEALELCHNRSFDGILMDVNLQQGLDGISTTKEIRKIILFTKVPIIAVTAYSMVGDREKFLNAGFSHYLSKPFTQKQLLKVLNSAVS